MALDNHIKLLYTPNYSNFNFINLAGLSKTVFNKEIRSAKIFRIEHFLDWIILICALLLGHVPCFEFSIPNDWVFNFLKKFLLKIFPGRNICVPLITTPFFSQTFLGLVSVLFLPLSSGIMWGEHLAIQEWKEIENDFKNLYVEGRTAFGSNSPI